MQLKNYEKEGLLYIILIGGLLCGNSTSYSQSIRYVDGIKTIINNEIESKSIEDNTYIKFVREFGEIYGNDENYQFYQPSDVLVDDENNIYVLDAGNERVQKFDQNLKFLMTFGGRGQGPGEFLYPFRFLMNSDGEIIISDARNHRFEVFNKNGKRIRGFKFEKNPSKFLLNSKNHIIDYGDNNVSMMGRSTEKLPEKPLIKVLNDGKVIQEIGKKIRTGNGFADFAANWISADIDNSDNIFVAYKFINKIEKYSPEGKLLLVIKKPRYADGPDLSKDKIDPQKLSLIQSNNFIDFNIDIAIDNQERLWVLAPNRLPNEEESDRKTFLEKTDRYDLESYSPEGVLITKIRLNHFGGLLRIFDNSLFILSGRVTKIYEYKIIR